jgi:hypothetical protein
MSTFALIQNVDVLSHVTRGHLEVFWLVWWGVDNMSQWSKSGQSDDGTLLTHGSLGHVP